ncbi:holo-ACP synthase [Streptomyces sp. H39-C1]|uniref:holo-ACP synthase n=1 Tax=Streptomyces sp. H39-C1 TaxID=3004355 RepID=UPI0022AEE938|nr:holo-ACP synthase [Streptomyces sp. H39-C1]MCZ4102294.1 holo-ACP synthase [Streptomyces sp. H39-C1]
MPRDENGPGAECPPGDIGVDIMLTSRVDRMLAEHGDEVLARMLTPAELGDCHRDGSLDILSVAGRLAAKEAAFKTLNTSGVVLPWLAMEVRKAPGGKPVLSLRSTARRLAEQAGVSGIRISIGHDGAYAVAIAAASPGSFPPPRTAPSAKENSHGRTAAADQGLDPQAPSRA